jgi:hypothetical protein
VPTPVSDSRSNKHEQVAHAAEVLQNAPNRLRVFEAIYRGKKAVKSRSDLEAATGLDNKQVLNAAKALVDNQLVSQEKKDGQASYRKDSFYSANKAKILSLARDPEKLAKQPRSTQVRGGATSVIRVAIGASFKPPQQVTVDDIDSFAAVKQIRDRQPQRVSISEDAVKQGIKRVLGESAEFKDWGGENNDLTTTRVRIGGKRCAAAFAFKGPAQKGKLTPGKMGKNGDQIQRLFQADADLFVVQYVGQIGENVVTQMSALAIAKAATTSKKIRYCLIDGQDTSRLMKAYSKEFGDD